MSDAAQAFLSAVDKLPRFDGLSFRGLPDGAEPPQSLSATTGVHASSRSPRVASENFATAALLVLLNRNARSLAAFSAHPDEREVVVLPNTVWRPLIELTVPGLDARVLVLEELDLTQSLPAPTEWGATLDELASRIVRVVQQDLVAAPVPVHIPGKFAGEWFSQEVRPS
ncbi:hypothetical protein [Cellulomonas sp. C5510]|uniref:hypothetical protein n=1 Tax=Cellulomonas sp. C5510 TaxID=2871170 RepID=UPI001C9392F3|nr:hypothetical protein [Cellulomonas sp. C5510]QZN86218.1 hypothetical protein K5O09_03180 [Cellulomonas sp. C5510]